MYVVLEWLGVESPAPNRLFSRGNRMVAQRPKARKEANPHYLPICRWCDRPIESPALIEDTLAIVGKCCPKCEKLLAKRLR